MTLNLRTYGILGAIVATGFVGLVYTAHRQDFCISQWRKVPDQEIFLEAMAGVKGFDSYSNPTGQSRGPYLEDNADVQRLHVMHVYDSVGGVVSGSILLPSDERRRLFGANFKSQDEKRRSDIRTLLTDPNYRVRCCALVERNAENGGRNYDHLGVLKGQKEKIVRIRLDEVAAHPASFSPPLERNPNISTQWQQSGVNTKIVGPVIQYRRKYTYVNVDVCGEREVTYS